MAGEQLVAYWDTCLFITWLTNETRTRPEENEGLNHAVREFEKGEQIIVTSTLTLTEAGRHLTPEQFKKLQDAFQRPGFNVVAPHLRICEKAYELRRYYVDKRKDNRTLGFVDAIHLATALVHEVKAFYTFDLRDSPNKAELGLLKLGNSVAGHSLDICRPPVATNPEFDFESAKDEAPKKDET